MNLNKTEVFADPKFVEPMLDYIVEDFEKSRIANNDFTIGGMVVCDSADQARELFRIFNEKYADPPEIKLAAEPKVSYAEAKKLKSKVKNAALILYDEGTK